MSALDVQVGGSHYKDCAIQPVQYIEANDLKFLEGCVVKRVTRHDKDTGKGRQDIEKAIHELELLLDLRYPIAPPAQDVAPTLVKVANLSGLQGCDRCDTYDHDPQDCPRVAAATVPDYIYTQ